jgi:hypothetical protein
VANTSNYERHRKQPRSSGPSGLNAQDHRPTCMAGTKPSCRGDHELNQERVAPWCCESRNVSGEMAMLQSWLGARANGSQGSCRAVPSGDTADPAAVCDGLMYCDPLAAPAATRRRTGRTQCQGCALDQDQTPTCGSGHMRLSRKCHLQSCRDDHRWSPRSKGPVRPR